MAFGLVKLRKTFENAPLVPIHTDQPGRFEELFGNVVMRGDGEWWEVGSIETGGISND